MAQANDAKGILYQNLIDAGCSDEMTKRCIKLKENGRETEMLDLLNNHRKDCALPASVDSKNHQKTE